MRFPVILAASRPWLAVLAAAVLPYLNSFDNGFHYDDEHSLLRNPDVRRLRAVPDFFTDSGTFSSEPAMAMYRPLLQTTFAANYALGGYDPRGWHVVNILLHALAAAGTFALFRTLAGDGPALMAGILFAVHPVHTQAVNYISSRSEVMCMALVLWALHFALRGRTAWGVLLYGAALLSKSAAVALMPVLALLQWRRPGDPRRWRRLAPFAVVTAGYVILIHIEGFLPRSLAQDVRSLADHLLTQSKAVVYYAKLAAFPRGLSVDHDFSLAAAASPVVVLAAAAVISLIALGVSGRQHASGLGVLWFFAGLGLTFAVPLNVLVNEHRLYLPMAGFALGVAVPLHRQVRRPGTIALLIAISVLLAVTTWERNRLWQNELTLWSSAVRQAPGSFRTWSNQGLALHEAGRAEEARAAYERSLQLNPNHARAWNNLGLLLEEEGDGLGAEQAYARAARLAPAFSGPLANLGRLRLARGDLDAASVALEAALTRNNEDVEALVNSGRLAQRQGEKALARERYERALDLDERSTPAANNLGLLLIEAGDRAGGRKWLQRARELDPTDEEAQINLALFDLEADGVPRAEAYRRLLSRFPGRGELALALGMLHAREGDWAAAVGVYERAVESGANAPGLQAALAAAYHVDGRFDEAIAAYRRALARSPGDLGSLNSLAAAAAAAGRLEEALDATRRALEIDPDDRRANDNREALEAAFRAPQKSGK